MRTCLRSRQSEGMRSPLSRPRGCRGTGQSRRSVLRWRTGEHVTFVSHFSAGPGSYSIVAVGRVCWLSPFSLAFLDLSVCRQQNCGRYAESDGLAPAVCATQALWIVLLQLLALEVALTPVIEKITAARLVHSVSAPTGIAPPTLVVVHTSFAPAVDCASFAVRSTVKTHRCWTDGSQVWWSLLLSWDVSSSWTQ